MKKTTLLLAAAALMAGSASAQQFGNPKDADGNYIVKWNPDTESFAEANDWEIDETFVFALDITGTGFEEAVKQTGRGSIGRGIAYDLFVTSAPEDTEGKKNIDGRLMHIKDNIYGMTVNFFQQHTTRFADAGLLPNADYTEYACCEPGAVVSWNANIFIFGWAADNPGAEWWDGVKSPLTDALPFACAPYTGTKTSPEFWYGDVAGEDYCPFEGLDPGSYHSMCDNWGGYAAPEHYKDVATAGVADAVAGEAATVASRYYNLQGQELKSEPAAGMFIRRDIKADGSAKAVKVMK